VKLLLLISLLLLLVPVAALAQNLAHAPLTDASLRAALPENVTLDSAEQSDHRSLHLPMAVYLTCAGLDVSTTMFALGRYPKQIAEGNKAVKWLADRPALFGVVEYAVPVAIYLLAQRHHEHAAGKEKKLIKWGLYGTSAMHCAAGISNTKLINSQGKRS